LIGSSLQELKGNIRVFCRVRPLLRFDGDSNGPEGASISFPTSVESAGRAIDLMNQGKLCVKHGYFLGFLPSFIL